MVGLEAVPRTLVWDGEGAIGRWRGGKTELTTDCQGFRGVLGTKVIVLKPREPEHKGIVERAHDYLERSFLPGRTFAGPEDFNAQLQGWLAIVNTRRRRALGCAPTDRIAADRHAMLQLPPLPPGVGWRSSTRLARDHYVRLDSNDYSVHPGVIGRRIEVVADLDRVKVYCEGRVVADHQRCLGLAPDPDRPRPPAGCQPPAPHPGRRPTPRTGRRGRAAGTDRLRHLAGHRPRQRPRRRWLRLMTARKTHHGREPGRDAERSPSSLGR